MATRGIDQGDITLRDRDAFSECAIGFLYEQPWPESMLWRVVNAACACFRVRVYMPVSKMVMINSVDAIRLAILRIMRGRTTLLARTLHAPHYRSASVQQETRRRL